MSAIGGSSLGWCLQHRHSTRAWAIGIYTHCLARQGRRDWLVWRGLSAQKHHPRRLRRLPLRCTRCPALRAALAPQLKGLLTAELLTPLEQRRRLIAQPFTARHLQFLTPPVPHHRLEVQHLPAITQPTSGAQPRWRAMSSVQPWQRRIRCSPWAIRPWCSWQVSRGMHSGPAWCRNQWQVMQTLRLRLGRSTP